jgi:hypothetical protein
MANHILGDAAYLIRRWLLAPFRDNGHLTDQQEKYNQYHSSNRVVIERAFALLKGHLPGHVLMDKVCLILLIGLKNLQNYLMNG